MPTIQARFQRKDKFGHLRFTVSAKKYAASFDTLKNVYDKIRTMGAGYMPVYILDTHASITFKNKMPSEPIEGAVYTVTFDVKKIISDGKTYINCFISNASLLHTDDVVTSEVIEF